MKKGRHRRYEEARQLKHTSDNLDILLADNEDPCEECEALPGEECRLVKSGAIDWCEYRENSPSDNTNGLFPS